MRSEPDPDQLRRRLKASLRAAMIARDEVAAAALRSAASAVDNAEAVAPAQAPKTSNASTAVAKLGVGAADVARRELYLQDLVDVVRAEIAERTTAAAEYERLGRLEQASRLKAEAAALASFLDGALNEPQLPDMD